MAKSPKIKWTVDDEGERTATVKGIEFKIWRAVQSGRHVFQLTAYRGRECLKGMVPYGWHRLKYEVETAENILNNETAARVA